MNKNVKRMFFVTALILLLVSISAVNAADTSNDTSSTIQQDVVKEVNVEKVSDTQVTDTTTKNIKKEETTTDLYVSDTDGSDENSGTTDSPYKTVQKALDQTNADSTFNIHIAEGTYKGLGNTNLTVNGNYNINFIGDGINKTVFDGEVEYTIKGGSAWGENEYWDYYDLISGNWAMNITEGTGHISISNMNFQHMLTIARDTAIQYNYLGTVTNYGNLSVNNVLFYQNLGGLGAGIQNKAGAKLYVNNSIFQENRKSSGTGNFGAGIYNNGTAIVENSQFIKNAARWGTITNDHIITINNCTLRDGISYDLSSTYKYGSGIASNTGSADYYNRYRIYGIITNINNCIFENNGQTDVYQAEGNLTLTNSTFNNATGVYLTDNIFNWNYNDEFSFVIENNTFDTVKISSLFTTLSSYSDKVFAIYSNSKYNALIKDNIITLNNDGFGIYLTNNNTVENNTLDSKIQVEGNYNNITQNTITNNEKATIYLGNSANNNIITDNTLKSLITTGNNAVSTNNQQNTIENNLPESPADVELSDETYSNFFNEDGTIKQDIANGTMIKIIGDVNNKNITIDNAKVGLKRQNGKLNNVSITIKENANALLDSLIINNTNDNPFVIQLESENNILSSSTINVNTTSPITAIIIKGDHNQLETNTLNIYGPSSNTTGIADTIAVSIESSNNILTNNNYFIYNTTANKDTYSIAVKVHNNNKKINNNKINEGRFNLRTESSITAYIENSDYNTVSFSNANTWLTGTTGIGTYLIDSDNNVIGSPAFVRGDTLENAYEIIIEGRTKVANNNSIKTPMLHAQAKNSTNIKLINANNTIITATNNNANFRTYNTGSCVEVLNSNNTDISYIQAQQWIINDNSSSMFKVINSDNTKINGISFDKTIGSYAQIINSTNTFIGQGTSQNGVVLKTTDVPIIIKNSTLTNITGITANIDNTVAIQLENSDNNSITNNFLKAQTNGGNKAIVEINCNNNELINNTPDSHIIYEENYDDDFTNGVFNKESTMIVIGSDFTDKTLIFKNPSILMYNPNNYTITGGKLEFTQEATESNITNLNTKDTQILIESSGLRLENSTITSDSDKLDVTIKNASDVIINKNTITAENQDGYAINVIDSDATITNNYILTKDTMGILSINCNNSQLTANNNIPTPKITDDNYNKFFDENGVYNASTLITLLEIGSDIYNKNFTFNTQITIDNPDKYTIYNTTISNTENEQRMTNLIINNTDYPYPTIISSNMNLENNIIYQSGNNLKVIVAENATNGATLQYNNITCDGDNNIIISCYNISLKTVMGNSIIANGSNVTAIYYNTTAIDEFFEEPISVFMVSNKIKINTDTPTTAMIFDNAAIELNNNEVIINTYNGETPIIKITNSLDGYVLGNYIESLDLYGDDAVSADVMIRSNTPTATGRYKVQMEVILPDYIFLNIENSIIVNVTDLFGRKITGLLTLISDDDEKTTDQNTFKITPTYTGEYYITILYEDPMDKYDLKSTEITINVIEPVLTVDPVTAVAGDTINITARITADDETLTGINKGKVTFKVNGKTLKDANGKVIYAKVVDGTATIENYLVPDDWTKEGTTIQAVYSGSSQCAKLTSEKTDMTITQKELTLTTEDITATAGSTITLTAALSDNTINTGKIVFKINGKTVKDTNGKVIYAKVVNGTVSVEYTLPADMKAKDYNLTATYISSDYRLEDAKTLTITA